jgi:hypothetical protein
VEEGLLVVEVRRWLGEGGKLGRGGNRWDNSDELVPFGMNMEESVCIVDDLVVGKGKRASFGSE